MYINYVYVRVFIHRIFDRHLVAVLMYVIYTPELKNSVTAEISSYVIYCDSFLTLCFKTK